MLAGMIVGQGRKEALAHHLTGHRIGLFQRTDQAGPDIVAIDIEALLMACLDTGQRGIRLGKCLDEGALPVGLALSAGMPLERGHWPPSMPERVSCCARVLCSNA